MKVEGSHHVSLSPETAWQRINDPAVVKRCTPGLTRLEETRPDHFEAVMELKLPAVRGRFEGSVDFLERVEPECLRMKVEGKGAPGFVNGDVELALAPEAGGTRFTYRADVQTGGQIARLGQRLVAGVAKDMAGQFFEAFGRADQVPAGAPVARSPLLAFLDLVWRSIKRAIGLAR